MFSPASPAMYIFDSDGEDEIDEPMAITPPPPPSPPPAPTGGVGTRKSTPEDVDLSVFDILNIFRRRWFLSRANLLANVISAQKVEDGKLSWVEFTPQFHSHLVKCAVALVPHPVRKVKKVLFGFILELLHGEGDTAFFELQKGGRKANNAQKEKRRLARKRSRAAKREREREAAKVAQGPPRFRECMSCGREFASRKTARRHKCSSSKVVRKPVEAGDGSVTRPQPSAQLDKPTATITPVAPPVPTHRSVITAVTGDSRRQSDRPLQRLYPVSVRGRWPGHGIQSNDYIIPIEAMEACRAEGWVPFDRQRKRPRNNSPARRSPTF